MGRFGKLFRLIDKAVSKRPDEVRRGIEKAARAADRKTHGKYRHHIDRGTRMAGKYLDKRGHGGRTRH